jgi:hypothetical protein
MERHLKRVNRNYLALLEQRSKSKEIVAGRAMLTGCDAVHPGAGLSTSAIAAGRPPDGASECEAARRLAAGRFESKDPLQDEQQKDRSTLPGAISTSPTIAGTCQTAFAKRHRRPVPTKGTSSFSRTSRLMRENR